MFLWDVIFPRRCLGCGRYGAYVCSECANSLKPVRHQGCLYCGRPSLWGLTHPACRQKGGVDGRIALYHYNTQLKKIIAGLKYRLVTDALPDLRFIIGRQAAFLTEVWRGCGCFSLQPIPLSAGRKNERGFNQAEIISRIFTSLLPLQTVNILERVRETAPQATLAGYRTRKKNIGGAFSVKDSPVPEKIILVDDVVTTGATVKEAARVLKAAGAKKVFALSVAKG